MKLGDMMMNINKFTNGLDSSRSRSNEPVKPTTSQGADSKAKESAGFTDQVKLSASSKSIQQIEAEIKDMQDVDDATVERIRSAIQNGEYKIDYEKLAGKMLDFEDRLDS
ncbi:flagellar biosynthesis anti-sigma factor FlgM [Thalassolituus sp.]|jgi:negative regulator of flagellin synthesis FlgM|uniref:flagellar biosynthesis anti-sigma factor FlgM n=1 Tax=Thalassolituus sp. TaxID=2030822 RepID=UPI0026136690|nr:flagellar biosynthesis anti-sigma factor FlgM [uncultured Thalassolituus sp.]